MVGSFLRWHLCPFMSPEELKLEHQRVVEHGHQSALERIRSFEQTLESATKTMLFSEIAKLAVDSFRSSKVRFALTALGMVIGTASLILVVTIGLTGKQYILNQIQAIGANMIYAYYEGGSNSSFSTVQKDELTEDDVRVVREVGGEISYVGSVVFSSTRLLNNHFDEQGSPIKAFCRELARDFDRLIE